MREFAARRNNSTRAKGYAPWRPQEKTLRLVGQIREILEELDDYLPLTARQLFYRLVGAYGYPKDERAYERLCNALGRARRSGMIPFGHLRDDSASVMASRHYAGVDGFYGHLRELAGRYERDKLASQPVDVRVYCEAAGMMPQLARVCRPYSVPVYSCSGFDSLTAKHDLARACHDNAFYEGRATVILHLGDLDPSGVSIYESMREDVLAFVADDLAHLDPQDAAIFERMALTEEMVEVFELTTAPPKRTDGRSARWRGETCQLEALGPDDLAMLLRETIEGYLDPEILKRDREEEARERMQVARALPGASPS